jgi:RNA polymerase sigma-70 factor (ECF subfamily)
MASVTMQNPQLPERCCLEIFEFVWEKRASLQIRATFRSFLFSSAKNRAISHYRREHRAVFTSLDIQDSRLSEEIGSQHFMEEKELRELIEAAIEKLPDQSRKIYVMAREEDLSHKEIAARLGITPKTVENHVGIALKKLRESLNPIYKQIFMSWLLPILFR